MSWFAISFAISPFAFCRGLQILRVCNLTEVCSKLERCRSLAPFSLSLSNTSLVARYCPVPSRSQPNKRERETPSLPCRHPTPSFNILRDALGEKNGPVVVYTLYR